MEQSKSRISVFKAASDIAVHPIPHFPEFDQHEKPHHVDYALNVVHHKHKNGEPGSPSSSATATVASEMSELYELRQELKHGWGKPKQGQRNQPNLKREHFNFREYLPYHIQFPQRVAVHLQRLLGTTEVHLNQPGFVSHLQEKIRKEEDAEVVKNAHHRAKMEFDRVKKLIIDGTVDYTTLPTDLQALKEHPAYKVKQMLDRLDAYDTVPDVVKTKKKIIPVEPFEFNGQKFFKHLHTTGDIHWIPTRRERKRASRTKRSKKEVVFADDQKNQKLKLLYKRPMSPESSESVPDMPGIEHFQDKKEEMTDASILDASHTYDIPSENGLKHFLQEQIIADALEQKKREQERKTHENKKEKLYEEQRRLTIKWRNKLISQSDELKLPLEERSLPSNIKGDTSFDRLRNSLGIRGVIDTHQYKIVDDPRILHLIDEADDANELFGNAEALNRLYAREARFVDKLLPALQRRLGMDH